MGLSDAQAGVARALEGVRRLGVAYSGGVDSAVLLALSARVLGRDCVLGVLGVSPSLADDERAAAHHVAAYLGVDIVEVSTREGDIPAYVANGPDRCFHCKNELFTRITTEVVTAYRLDAVAYGENADDCDRLDRPGARAAADHHVLRPLAEAGLTKDDVRAVARELGLPCADKPAAPCLASRIPHHSDVTPTKLLAVARAERVLRDLGFTDGRVRHHGDVARVELAAAEIERAIDPGVRQELLDGIRAAGFRFVALDLGGIQSGAFTLQLVQARD